MLDGVRLANDRGEAHDDGGEGRLDVLVRIGDQVLHAGQQLGHDQALAAVSGQGLAEILHLNNEIKVVDTYDHIFFRLKGCFQFVSFR